MWKLVIEDDEGTRTVVPLGRDSYTLGRNEGNAIRLTERNVSRNHARIERRTFSPSVTTRQPVRPAESGTARLVGARPAAEETTLVEPAVQAGRSARTSNAPASGGDGADGSPAAPREQGTLGDSPPAEGPVRESYVLYDLKSYNGVYVNGLRVVDSQDLSHGDLVQIGDYRILLEDEEATAAAAAQKTHPDQEPLLEGASAVGRAPSPSRLHDQPNRLVMLAGPTPGAEYPLTKEHVIVGRAEDADISVNHNSVSRIHCEIRPLGDGRFEVVDKGSSNGVRVNGSDLRRGIVEDGDTIELGDVRFKLVGAGKIFRPGPTESQQLTAVGDRTAAVLAEGESDGPRRAPVVAVLLLAAAAAFGLWYHFRGTDDAEGAGTPPPKATSRESAVARVVEEAARACEQWECEGAFEKVESALLHPESFGDEPADWRTQPYAADAKRVVARWVASTFERAATEPDLDRRRFYFERVAKASSVIEDGDRAEANKRLHELEEFRRTLGAPSAAPERGGRDGGRSRGDGDDGSRRPTPPVASAPGGTNHGTAHTTANATAGASAPGTSAATGQGGTAQTGSSGTASAPAAPRAIPAAQSDMDRIRELMLQGPDGMQKARAILEPKVFGHRGSAAEINALKAICKAQSDRACVDQCRTLLGGQTP
jgi:pSer/pThr/pTyr-binding forkhead associated (FHA) protein